MARKAAAPGDKKKRRRRKMKLTLRSRGLKKESDTYSDKVGWSQVKGENEKPRKSNQAPSDTNVLCAARSMKFHDQKDSDIQFSAHILTAATSMN